MKHVVLVVFLGACAVPSSDTRNVKDTFERWRFAVVQGNFDAVYDLMGARMKSQWLWQLVHPRIATTSSPKKEIIKSVPQDLYSQFEAWYRAAALAVDDREVALDLPVSISKSKWLRDTLAGVFQEFRTDLAREFRNLEIKSISVEPPFASVATSGETQTPHVYTLVIEDDGMWRIFNYVGPAR